MKREKPLVKFCLIVSKESHFCTALLLAMKRGSISTIPQPVRNIHGKKALLGIWWDQKEAVYYDLLKPSKTVTGDRYRQQLIKLNQALKRKRPEWGDRTHKVILLHNNARPHAAKPVKTYLENIKWDALPHALYSPDLVPSDYYLFRLMQHGLSEQHFNSYKEVKNWIDEWLASKGERWYWAREKESTSYQKDGKKSLIMMADTLIIKFIQFVIETEAYFNGQTAVSYPNAYYVLK